MNPNSERIQIIQDDITRLEVDAIVNAANRTLLGGGGVDGAIHRAAGFKLRLYCAKLGGCATGQAKITPGFKLPAKWIIHTVGPVWRGGRQGEPDLLAGCYRHSLELAAAYPIKTIAFPAISTGVYGYPLAQATAVALREIARFLSQDAAITQIYLVSYGSQANAIMQQVYREVFLP
ncbi:MAG: O-acetyl-ADP-ribose deacetylase [Anaerolineae bacterium]